MLNTQTPSGILSSCMPRIRMTEMGMMQVRYTAQVVRMREVLPQGFLPTGYLWNGIRNNGWSMEKIESTRACVLQRQLADELSRRSKQGKGEGFVWSLFFRVAREPLPHKRQQLQRLRKTAGIQVCLNGPRRAHDDVTYWNIVDHKSRNGIFGRNETPKG